MPQRREQNGECRSEEYDGVVLAQPEFEREDVVVEECGGGDAGDDRTLPGLQIPPDRRGDGGDRPERGDEGDGGPDAEDGPRCDIRERHEHPCQEGEIHIPRALVDASAHRRSASSREEHREVRAVRGVADGVTESLDRQPDRCHRDDDPQCGHDDATRRSRLHCPPFSPDATGPKCHAPGREYRSRLGSGKPLAADRSSRWVPW